VTFERVGSSSAVAVTVARARSWSCLASSLSAACQRVEPVCGRLRSCGAPAVASARAFRGEREVRSLPEPRATRTHGRESADSRARSCRP
jgi:hypothetical protein